MKQTQFYIAVALSAVCLLLAVVLIALGQSSQSAQLDLQKRQNEVQIEVQQRQAEVNKGEVSQRVGTAILQDMASVALKNSKIKDVLAKNGYNVTAAPSPSVTGTGTNEHAGSANSPKP
jgi:type II secretory pathway pseudopilin PulG